MRLYAALAALLVACAADPAVAPRDCTPGQTAACVCPGAAGSQTCGADGRLGACVCLDGSVDGAAAVDVVAEDRAAAIDAVTALDVVAQVDVVDAVADAASAPDAPDGGVCPNGTRAVCDGRQVNLDVGEPDGGIRYHCGACGRHCGVGEFCLNCACTR